MAEKEITIIRRGTPRQEYLEYFLTLGGSLGENGVITGPDWEVVLGEEREVFVCGKLLETEIIFRAEGKRCDELIQAFRAQFLRAGG
ncbi:MAG: hypothetical protein KGZ63_02255 [Clostridiales bacterium]|jgi:hypothetical protein|nr:hypothetical protein [Clostridiales bacterium]